VIVADVDTGMDYNNADLIDNSWLNQAEIPSSVLPKLQDVYGDGIISFNDLNSPVNQGPGKIVDTNGDGVISGTDVIAPASAGGWASGSIQDGNTLQPDDLIGWNFVGNNNSPMDGNGHGTITAGEIGAVGNNGIGVTGVEWNAQIMPVQAFDATGSGTDVAAAEAIDYAVQNGAKVINCSFTGINTEPVFAQAIDYADSKGVIIVAAAGNSCMDLANPLVGFQAYPNVITVASIDSDGDLSGWSNYGAGSVQLAAPGSNILSTLYGGDGYDSGASMAAPFVTGTVALVEVAHPTWSMSQVIDAIVDHTTPDPALTGLVTSGGVLNAGAAVSDTDGAYVTSASPNGLGTSASPLSSIQLTFNEEINPATFTPSQVTLTGPGGTISGVTVTAVAGSNDHQFLISFASQTAGGTYTLKVGPSIQDWYGNSMDQNRNGVNGEASDAFVYVVRAASATFVVRDSTTQGNWIGVYGSQGYNIIGASASQPSYATVSVSGETPNNWASPTSDPRALQIPGGASRIAASWYSGTSFTVNINLTDGQAHDVAIYALDWPEYGRSEQIQVQNASSGAVLDTETISNFNTGLYLRWQLTGDVNIQFSSLGGINTVVSGLFFDPPPQPYDSLNISSSSTTDTAGTAQTFTVTAIGPNGATDTPYTGTIHYTSADPQAVLPVNYTFTAADAGVHTFTATLETAGTESITATDTTTQSTTGTESNVTVSAAAASSFTVSGFPNPDTAGTAGNFTVTAYDPYGNVATGYAGTVHFTSTDPQASLPLNYLFTAADAGKHTFSATLKTAGTQSITATDAASARITGTASVAVVVSVGTASPVLVKRDSTTEGNWIGAYGSQGYNVFGGGSSSPSYATYSVSGASANSWASSTSDPRALQTASGAGRVAVCWYSSTSFAVHINLTDGRAHDVAIYALDWPEYGRSEQIQVQSASTGAVLDTETISNFNTGLYLQWQLTGNVIIQFSAMGGMNAVVSGLFFDPVSSIHSLGTTSVIGPEIAAPGNSIRAYGDSVTNGIGTVNFSTSDSQSVLPADFTFAASLAGVPEARRHR